MRIKKEDLKRREERVNKLLKNINLKVAYRYNYTAIDVYDKAGKIIDTLVAGLTKKEAYTILETLELVLLRER